MKQIKHLFSLVLTKSWKRQLRSQSYFNLLIWNLISSQIKKLILEPTLYDIQTVIFINYLSKIYLGLPWMNDSIGNAIEKAFSEKNIFAKKNNRYLFE